MDELRPNPDRSPDFDEAPAAEESSSEGRSQSLMVEEPEGEPEAADEEDSSPDTETTAGDEAEDDAEDEAEDEADEATAESGSDPSGSNELDVEEDAGAEATDGEAGDSAEAGEAAPSAEGDANASERGDSEEEDDASKDVRGPGWDLSEEELVRRTSALIFASPGPLGLGRLVKLLEGAERARVKAALEVISQRLESADLGLQLRALAGGWLLMTTPDLGEVVGRLAKGSAVEKVSPAALETLAVVAYRQPVTKAEIEAIRGVQAGPILRTLVDRGLVRVTGRADVPGHPLQYGTTREFLDRFGLMSLKDLPRDSELARG